MVDLWPVRRWLADRLVGKRSYSRHLATVPQEWMDATWWNAGNTATTTTWNVKPFDQETA